MALAPCCHPPGGGGGSHGSTRWEPPPRPHPSPALTGEPLEPFWPKGPCGEEKRGERRGLGAALGTQRSHGAAPDPPPTGLVLPPAPFPSWGQSPPRGL